MARSAGVAAVRAKLAHCLHEAREVASSASTTPTARAAAIALLGYSDFADVHEALSQSLSVPRESVQLAALSALDRFDDSGAGETIVARFSDLTGRARSEAATVLLRRPQRAIALLNAIGAKRIRQSDLDAAQINQLLNYRADDAVRTLARSVLKAPSTQRTEVVEAFRPALSLTGDAVKGKLLYEQRCISCHRGAGEGHSVGPDLVSVRNSGKEKLLLNILDPSREVAPQYVSYLIETRDGQSVLGILASDTPASLTVRQAYSKETVIARSQIKRMRSDGKSLMPDGLEAGLTPQDLADLIAFVESVK
jgi:putative heme-binding domain-containing protein